MIHAQERTNFAPPFAIAASGKLRPLWTLSNGARITEPATRFLARGSIAESPWIDTTPGVGYRLLITGNGTIRVSATWFDAARRSLVTSASAQTLRGAGNVTLTTFSDAAGFRLQLSPDTDDATVTALSLVLTSGVRVEPFPAFHRAAFAFSYDWESAMGGLIHTRSPAQTEGDGTQVSLHEDGSPIVADAEDKGIKMRDGARFLADQFAQHGIRATFYTTGYNLLSGNPNREQFLNSPLYPNTDTAHGWGSDYWRSHPWYGHDPYGTEQTHPAWYFASVTRELATAGHEIASHTFGHLYVRGVKPEQLEADLRQWQQAATALGISAAPSFAFPWTSSNSLDGRFWTIFAQLGWTVLTRLYPHDLRTPYELDRIPANPRLTVFPDLYLPSHLAMRDEALARIEETLARRGYHSLWTHPYEVLEQDGQAVWVAVIAAASDARERGLWVAPVTEIARYTLATRGVVVRSAGGGIDFTIENQSDQAVDGLTLTLAGRIGQILVNGQRTAEVRGDQVRVGALAVGKAVRVEGTFA